MHLWLRDLSKFNDSVQCREDALQRCFNVRDLKRSEHGKPYLDDHAVEISVSHSDRLWVLAWSETCVGVDVEYVPGRHQSPLWLKRRATPMERAWVMAQPCLHTAALRLWCAKEAMIKYHGVGGFSELRRCHITAFGSEAWQGQDGLWVQTFAFKAWVGAWASPVKCVPTWRIDAFS